MLTKTSIDCVKLLSYSIFIYSLVCEKIQINTLLTCGVLKKQNFRKESSGIYCHRVLCDIIHVHASCYTFFSCFHLTGNQEVTL